MKKRVKNLYEPVDKQPYKKKYLLRKIEDNEADDTIREYTEDNNGTVPLPEVSWMAEAALSATKREE